VLSRAAITSQRVRITSIDKMMARDDRVARQNLALRYQKIIRQFRLLMNK